MKLTAVQTSALEWLDAQHVKFPGNDYGFNPQGTYRHRYVVMRKQLEPLGLVRVNRLAPTHFRYSITESGRLALSKEKT